MSKRLIVNLIVFFAVSIALIVYGYGALIGNPLQPPTQVSAVFPNASGLYNNFSVQLNGVDVGSVTGVTLTSTGARVDMAIKHGVNVPGDVQASIDAANDLGEQVVELTPQHGGTAQPLTSGAVIPAAPGGIPADVGKVVGTATTLLKAIPAGQLNALLAELATALNGRSEDLRTIVSASTVFSQEFLAYQQQFRALLANAPPVLNAVTAVGPQLQDALNNTQTLVQVLATQRFAIDQLLKQGTGASNLLDNLVSSQAANLGCLITDLSQVSSNLAQPANLTPLSNALADNQYFFGAVDNVLQPGTAKALKSGEQNNSNQLFLRTRLLLPPQSPSADTYASPQGLPATLPGPACSNQLGTGVPAATQAGKS
jgi:phospholipid/cholesterol/gamma-HCH transport system substrate-binding protein